MVKTLEQVEPLGVFRPDLTIYLTMQSKCMWRISKLTLPLAQPNFAIVVKTSLKNFIYLHHTSLQFYGSIKQQQTNCGKAKYTFITFD